MNEIEANKEYVMSSVKETVNIVPHTVILKTRKNGLGRRVLDYVSLREYDIVQPFKEIEFTDGVAIYKGDFRGFIVQCVSGSIAVNFSSDRGEKLEMGMVINAGDVVGMTDVVLKKIRIDSIDGTGTGIISFIGSRDVYDENGKVIERSNGKKQTA